MDSSQQKPQSLTLWERLTNWLVGEEPKPQPPVRKSSGETEIFLSNAQRKKLEEAVSAPDAQRWETSFYRRETSFHTRPTAAKPVTDKDGLII